MAGLVTGEREERFMMFLSSGRFWVGKRSKAVRAPARSVLFVILGDEPSDVARELLGERRAIGGVCEAHFAREGERGDRLAGVVGALLQRRDLARRLRRRGDEVCRREAIARRRSAARESAERFGRDEIRPRRR